MEDLLAIPYSLGPGMAGISLAYLLRHPEDWSGPAIVLPLSLIFTVLVHYVGYMKLECEWHAPLRQASRIARYSGLIIGLVVFLMGYFGFWN